MDLDPLVHDPEFADSTRLTDIAHTYAAFALDILAEDEPAAARLRAALVDPDRARRTLRSPALRFALNHLLAGHRTDPLRAVLDQAATAGPGLLEGDALPLGPYDLFVPHDPAGPADATLRHAFATTVVADLDTEGHRATVRLDRPEPAETATLRAAVALLDAAVPALAGSVAAHVRLVAIARSESDTAEQLLSASNSALPGALFLSGPALRDRLAAAEALLHEATHQRLYDLMLCRRLYAPGPGPTVLPPWYAGESGHAARWPVDRVLAALHVYVHVATLWLATLRAADGLAPAGPVPAQPAALRAGGGPNAAGGPSDGGGLSGDERGVVAGRLGRCLDKGDYLLGALRGPVRPALGPDGERFVDFLAAGLDRLHRAAPSMRRAS